MPTQPVQFESHLSEVTKATREQLAKAAEIIGGMAEGFAKESCPVNTGNLRDSITHQTEETESGVDVIIGTIVTYAPYVELGTGKFAEGGGGRQTPWRYQDDKGRWHTTSGMSPRPYLRPAIENHIGDYKGVVEQVLKE